MLESKLLWRERDWRTGGDDYRLLYWPITSFLLNIPRSVIFLRPLSTSSASAGKYSTGSPLLANGPSGAPRHELVLPWVTQVWDSDYRISRGHLYTSFHNTYTFPFNHFTASAHFHKCVLTRESLIYSSVKGQYATLVIVYKKEKENLQSENQRKWKER